MEQSRRDRSVLAADLCFASDAVSPHLSFEPWGRLLLSHLFHIHLGALHLLTIDPRCHFFNQLIGFQRFRRYIGSSKPLTGPTSRLHLVMRSMLPLQVLGQAGNNRLPRRVFEAMPLSVIAFMTAIGVSAPATTELSRV